MTLRRPSRVQANPQHRRSQSWWDIRLQERGAAQRPFPRPRDPPLLPPGVPWAEGLTRPSSCACPRAGAGSVPPPRAAACGEPQSIRAERVWTGRRAPLTSAPTSSAEGCAVGTRGGTSERARAAALSWGCSPRPRQGNGVPVLKGGPLLSCHSVPALMPSFSCEICHQQQLHLI